MRLLLTLFLLMASGCATTSSYTGTPLEGSAFQRYQSADGQLRYYLAPSPEGPRPLLVVVQGSGCESVFVRRTKPDGQPYLAATAAQDIIQSFAAKHFCVMIVEKPGVKSEAPAADTDTPGASNNCSEEFRASHSLPLWTHQLSLAIDAAQSSSHVVRAAGVRVLGLSEGSIVAARLARERSDISHIVFISGFGCDQWRDMLVVAGRNAEATGTDVAASIARTQSGLERVAADPLNSREIFEDQTYLYWSTFGRACPAQDLAQTNADVFVALGTSDEQVDSNGVEAIPASRLAAGKPITVQRIISGSHVLNTPTTKPFENLIKVFRDAVEWMSPGP